MWRVVGIGVGLLRHDGEVEGVVVKDDAVLELCVRGRTCYAQAHIPKRRRHHGVPSDPLPSDVSDPIVTIETSKIPLALEDGSK